MTLSAPLQPSDENAQILADFFSKLDVLCRHIAEDLEFVFPNNSLRVAIDALVLGSNALGECKVNAQEMLNTLRKQSGLTFEQADFIRIARNRIDRACTMSQIPSDDLARLLMKDIDTIRSQLGLSDEAQEALATSLESSYSPININLEKVSVPLRPIDKKAKLLTDFCLKVNSFCQDFAKEIKFSLPDNNLKVASKLLKLGGSLERCKTSTQQILKTLGQQPGLSPQQRNTINVTGPIIDQVFAASDKSPEQLASQIKDALYDIRFQMGLSKEVQEDLAIVRNAGHSTTNQVIVFDSYRMTARIDAILHPAKDRQYESVGCKTTGGAGVVLIANLDKWLRPQDPPDIYLMEDVMPDGLDPEEKIQEVLPPEEEKTQEMLPLEETLEQQYEQIERIESELKRTFPYSAIFVDFFSRKFLTPEGTETTGLAEAQKFLQTNTAILNKNLSANFIPADSSNLTQHTTMHGVSFIKYEPYWELPFPDKTESGDFILANGTKVTTEMMKLADEKIAFNETYGNDTLFVMSLPTRLNPEINSDGLIRRKTGEKGQCIIARLDPKLTAAEMSEAGQNLFNDIRIYGTGCLGLETGHADITMPLYSTLGACWYKDMLSLTQAKVHQKGASYYTITERPEVLFGGPRYVPPDYIAKLDLSSPYVEIMVSEEGTPQTWKLLFNPESKSEDEIRRGARDKSLIHLLSSPPPERLSDIIQKRDLKTVDLAALRSVENLIKEHAGADEFSIFLVHAGNSEHLYEKEFINFMLVCMLNDPELRTRIVDYIRSAFIYFENVNWGPRFPKVLDGIAYMMADTNKLKNYDPHYYIKALGNFLEKTPEELAEMGIKNSGHNESPENIVNIFQQFCPGTFENLNIPDISFSPRYSHPKFEYIAAIENNIEGLLKTQPDKKLSFFVGYTERNDIVGKVVLVNAWFDESGKCEYELIDAPRGEKKLNQLPPAKNIWIYHPVKKTNKDLSPSMLALVNTLSRPARAIDAKYEERIKENARNFSLRQRVLHAKNELWRLYGGDDGLAEVFIIYDNLILSSDKKMMQEIFSRMLENPILRKCICYIALKEWNSHTVNNEINRRAILDKMRNELKHAK
ncbi:hypothetical protein [Glaciimonas sp. GG7]